MMGTVKARSAGRALASRATTTPEKAAAAKLEHRMAALADKALALAEVYRGEARVHPEADLTDTAQGELHAAAMGSLGLSRDAARRCGDAMAAYESARRERGERQQAARRTAGERANG